MLKPLIAALTVASLTFASPAQAQNFDRSDVGKLIVGIAALAALNAAIEQREKTAAREVHDRRYQANRWSGDDRRWSERPRRGNRWSDLSRRSNVQRTIPAACLREVRTRFGVQQMFGRRCLERNYTHVGSLPDRCAVRVYTTNGPRRGFDPLCLREQGYRTDRRR